jgi:DNA-binding CsgD family transcriptional regulator
MPENDQRRGEAADGGLTVREHEVLDLVRLDLREDEIAARLRISPSTVALLLRSSMAKLGARTRLEAVAMAAATGRPAPVNPRTGGTR